VELQRVLLVDAQPRDDDERLLIQLVDDAMDCDESTSRPTHEQTRLGGRTQRHARPSRAVALLAAFVVTGVATAWGVVQLTSSATRQDVAPARAPVRITPQAAPAEAKSKRPRPESESESESETQSTEAQAPREVAAKPSAEQLFQQGKQAERSGQGGVARARFTQLQSLYPNSPEAHVSRMVMGGLLLESGEAQGALRQYSAYLARGGSLEQEALVGKARSLARLGDSKAEAQTWQTLLGKYPKSLHASRARQRLDSLGSSP